MPESTVKERNFNMKDTRKEFIFVISKSEEMDKSAMLEGFNSLVEAQKAIKDESTYSLMFFNDTYKMSAVTKSFKEMRKYTPLTYAPKGRSAIYDAIGHAMTTVGEALSDTVENERPSLVCMIIIGNADNASTVFDYDTLKEMINVQKYVYKWDFVLYSDDELGFDIQKGGNLSNIKKMFDQINSYMTSLR